MSGLRCGRADPHANDDAVAGRRSAAAIAAGRSLARRSRSGPPTATGTQRASGDRLEADVAQAGPVHRRNAGGDARLLRRGLGAGIPASDLRPRPEPCGCSLPDPCPRWHVVAAGNVHQKPAGGRAGGLFPENRPRAEHSIADFFFGWRWLPHAFLVQLVVGLAVGAGFLCCVVPGIFIAIIFSQAMYLVVDHNAPIGTALGASYRLTDGYKLQLFGLYLVVWLLIIAAAIPCGLGLILVWPWKGILDALVYLSLTGQPIATGDEV